MGFPDSGVQYVEGIKLLQNVTVEGKVICVFSIPSASQISIWFRKLALLNMSVLPSTVIFPLPFRGPVTSPLMAILPFCCGETLAISRFDWADNVVLLPVLN